MIISYKHTYMLYNLRNGRTVDIPLEIYLLSDNLFEKHIQVLEARAPGDEINDPFFGSALENDPTLFTSDEDFPDIDDVPDLTEIPIFEKLSDSDFEVSE